MNLERDVRERREHHEADHRREPVEAVDDVDRIGESRHRKHRDRRGHPRIREREVQPRHADADDRCVEQPIRECRGGHRCDESCRRAHALGQVLDEPGCERGQPAAGQQQDAVGDRRIRAAQLHGAARQPEQEADAADAWHRPDMELLHAAQIRVGRQALVRVRVMDDDERDQQRNQKGNGEAEHECRVSS
ncbi:hypothetical protein DFQ30_002073, partial [Apophysomyces sp. BC1015]